MPNTRIWTLPPSTNDDYNHALSDFTRPDRQRVFYVKYIIGALHRLDTINREVLQWTLSEAMTPPSAIKGEHGGVARIALTPGRANLRAWATVPGWQALVELDPGKNQLRFFNATGAPGRLGYPLLAVQAVLPQSATRIWFSAKDYDLDYPVIGLLDTEELRITYWILSGPSKDGEVGDLVLDAAGRVWFACQNYAAQGEQVAFLGMLNPTTRQTRYWLTSGVHEIWPDRRVGCIRLGAKNRLAATSVWLVSRNHYGSFVCKFDTETLAPVNAANTNLNDGLFSIAIARNGHAIVCYRDFLNVYTGTPPCAGPTVFPSVLANARKEFCDANVSVFKVEPHRRSVTSRFVETNQVVLSSCMRELTPDNPSMCSIIQRGADNALWLGRELGYEIGIYTP